MGKRHKLEEIIGKLRDVEVRLTQGKRIGVIRRVLCVSKQCYYRWRRENGGTRVIEASDNPGELDRSALWHKGIFELDFNKSRLLGLPGASLMLVLGRKVPRRLPLNLRRLV